MKNKCEICGAESGLEEVYSCACDKDSPSATLCKKCKDKYFDYLLPGNTGILRYIPSVPYIPFLTYAENLVYAYEKRYGKSEASKTIDEKEATTMQVSYNGFTGELVKLKQRRIGIANEIVVHDISIYDVEKKATYSFSEINLADVKFLGGAVSFGG